MPSRSEHPYLSGNYAPVPDETILHGLALEGTIPAALNGLYLRIGPNPIGNPTRPYDWSAADGMVHAISIGAGRAPAYRNRWVITEHASTTLGTEPVEGTNPRGTDTSNTNVIVFAGRTLTFGRNAAPYELGADLETRRRVEFFADDRRLCPRPKIDPRTGELHLISSSTAGQCVVHQTVTPEGRISLQQHATSAIDLDINDFVLTDDHVILFTDVAIGVLRQRGGRHVDWFENPSTAMVHPISAFATGETVTAYVTDPALARWTVDLARRVIRREVLDSSPRAFGRINVDFSARPHRYAYTIGHGAMPFDGTEIVKHDLTTRTARQRDFGAGRHPGEFIFVADPQRQDHEDGGWLLGLVHDDGTGQTELVVLDATHINAPAVATIHTTRRIPYGLHGSWAQGPAVRTTATAWPAVLDSRVHEDPTKERP